VVSAGIPFAPISAAPVVGRGVLGRLRAVVSLSRGLWQSWRLAGRQRPQALLVTGGYVCVPVALAAWVRRIPLYIYLPDIQPGLAIRFLARFARRIAVTAPAAEAFLPAGRCKVTGYPTRVELRAADRQAARRRWSLMEADRLLLVFGGSQGSRRINEALAAAAPRLLEHCHLLHLSGPRDLAAALAAREAMPAASRERYHLEPYLDSAEMALALAAADLAVCRAGAATLGECPALGLPAILVPLPISGGHQWPNARFLQQAGAAEVLADADCSGAALTNLVLGLLSQPDRLRDMGRRARSLDRPAAAEDIWAMVAQSLPGPPPRVQGVAR